MMQGIERYMKQAIVDKSPAVASAALTSAMVSYLSVMVEFITKYSQANYVFVLLIFTFLLKNLIFA